MRVLYSVLLLAFGGAVQAAPVTIDFENTVDNGGAPFTVPQGFSVSGFFLTQVTSESGFPSSPSGGDGESLALLGSYRAYTDLTQVDGLSFDLLSLDVHFECGGYAPYCISDDWIISAYDANDDLIIESNFFPDSYGWATLQFNGDWQDITRLRINTWAGSEGSVGFVDNIALNVVPIPAAVWLFGSALFGLGWFRRLS